jgi:hypothetical protein
MKKALLLLSISAILVLGAPGARAETFMLLVEELHDGIAAGQPLASEEGLMARMFELGQVTFDSGPYAPEADWAQLQFREPLELAREGLAHYLAAVRVQAQTLGSVPAADGPPGLTFAQVRAQAQYYLYDAGSGDLLEGGESTLDNLGREQELPFDALLFQTGDLTARELVKLSRRGTAKG